MLNLVWFLIVYTIVLLFYLLFLIRRRIKKYNKVVTREKGTKVKRTKGDFSKAELSVLGEATYIINKFKLVKEKCNLKRLQYIMAFVNAFIIASVSTIIGMIELNYIWKLLIGFGLLFALIYSIYEIIGRALVRRGWK